MGESDSPGEGGTDLESKLNMTEEPGCSGENRCVGRYSVKSILSVAVCIVGCLFAILVFAAVLAAWGIGAKSDKDDSGNIPSGPGIFATSFCSDAVLVSPGAHFEWFQGPFSPQDFGLPDDKPIMVQTVAFHLEDPHKMVVPLEHVYNHHIFLLAGNDLDSLIVVAGYGAEGALSKPLNYGHTEGLLIPAGTMLWLTGEWIDVYGKLATTNQTTFPCFQMTYKIASESQIAAYNQHPLHFGLFGTAAENGFEYAIPPNPNPGASCFSQQAAWAHDSIEIVYIFGHVHIGAVNQSLIDVESSRSLVVSRPEYDFAGYLSRIDNDIKVNRLILTKDKVYRTVSCYSNRDHGYSGVMSLWGIFFLNLDNPLDDIDFETDEK